MTARGAPMIMDFVTREHVLPQFSVEEARTYFRLMLAANHLARPFAVGPGVPKDRVEALRQAVMAVAADPASIADNRKEGRDVDPTPGSEMQAIFAELAATPRPILANARELAKFKGVVKQGGQKPARRAHDEPLPVPFTILRPSASGRCFWHNQLIAVDKMDFTWHWCKPFCGAATVTIAEGAKNVL